VISDLLSAPALLHIIASIEQPAVIAPGRCREAVNRNSGA
jgi:hypothetical protein